MDTSNTSLSVQAASNSKGMDKLWIKITNKSRKNTIFLVNSLQAL
jgi:hypothetical protein